MALKRSTVHRMQDPLMTFHNDKVTLGDTMHKGEWTSPVNLVNDIKFRLCNGESFFQYTTADIIRMAYKTWKHYDKMKFVPITFTLTIEVFDNRRRLKIEPDKGVFNDFIRISEFSDPNDLLNEVIAVDMRYFNMMTGKNSKTLLTKLLERELGHAWQFLFNTIEEVRNRRM